MFPHVAPSFRPTSFGSRRQNWLPCNFGQALFSAIGFCGICPVHGKSFLINAFLSVFSGRFVPRIPADTNGKAHKIRLIPSADWKGIFALFKQEFLYSISQKQGSALWQKCSASFSNTVAF